MKNKQTILINHDINFPTVRLVAESGTAVMPIANAKAKARDAGLDLVVINTKADPPVCQILDANKYLYEQKVKLKADKKAQRDNRITVKEVQFKPNIDNHDFTTKCNKIAKFIDKGNTVKIQVQFKGRERQHVNLGYELIDRLIEELENITIESKPQFSGNRITAVIKGSKDSIN